jgi:uncharacterized protein (UPF0254 family)
VLGMVVGCYSVLSNCFRKAFDAIEVNKHASGYHQEIVRDLTKPTDSSCRVSLTSNHA